MVKQVDFASEGSFQQAEVGFVRRVFPTFSKRPEPTINVQSLLVARQVLHKIEQLPVQLERVTSAFQAKDIQTAKAILNQCSIFAEIGQIQFADITQEEKFLTLTNSFNNQYLLFSQLFFNPSLPTPTREFLRKNFVAVANDLQAFLSAVFTVELVPLSSVLGAASESYSAMNENLQKPGYAWQLGATPEQILTGEVQLKKIKPNVSSNAIVMPVLTTDLQLIQELASQQQVGGTSKALWYQLVQQLSAAMQVKHAQQSDMRLGIHDKDRQLLFQALHNSIANISFSAPRLSLIQLMVVVTRYVELYKGYLTEERIIHDAKHLFAGKPSYRAWGDCEQVRQGDSRHQHNQVLESMRTSISNFIIQLGATGNYTELLLLTEQCYQHYLQTAAELQSIMQKSLNEHQLTLANRHGAVLAMQMDLLRVCEQQLQTNKAEVDPNLLAVLVRQQQQADACLTHIQALFTSDLVMRDLRQVVKINHDFIANALQDPSLRQTP